MALPKTYTFFLHYTDRPDGFEPVMCADNIAAMAAARARLAEEPACMGVDVHLGVTELFSLKRSA